MLRLYRQENDYSLCYKGESIVKSKLAILVRFILYALEILVVRFQNSQSLSINPSPI